MKKRQMIFEPREKRVADDVKVYSCYECANRKSPLCDSCTQISSPDGSESKPKYFITLTEFMPSGQYRRLEGRAETCAELLELYLRTGWPLPIAIVMEYNEHIEKKREEKQK